MKKQLLILLGIVLFAIPCEAVSKIYVAPETSITWTDSGGDEVLDLGSLAADGLVMGSYHDMGSASHASDCMLEVTIDGFDTAPVVGEAVNVYLSFSNATTNFDGNPTIDPQDATAGTITAAQVDNCLFVGSLIVYSTTAGDELKNTFHVSVKSRYVSVIIENATADALLGTADAHTIDLTPIPYESQ